MLNINLVPEVKKEQAKVKKIRLITTSIVFVIAAALVAAILILGSLLAYRSARVSTVKRNIEKINDELLVYKDLEVSVLTLEKGLAEIKGIIDGGRDWSVFFEDIEKATPGDVRFIGFKVTGNSVSADLKGKDVQSIDRFIKSFSNYTDEDGNKLYSGVVVDGYTSRDGGGVSFQAKFDVVGGTK